MTKGLFWTNSISTTQVPSGDYFDSAEEDGIRIAGKVPVVDVTGGSTTMKAIDAGFDYIGDSTVSGGTGSTAVAAFSTAFTAIPRIVGTPVHSASVIPVLGSGSSLDLTLAGIAAGSAIFLGISGVGVQWMAYGDKY